MIEVDGNTNYAHYEKTEAKPGQRMSFRGIELVAVSNKSMSVTRCENCAVNTYNIACSSRLPFFCKHVVFMQPLDAITFKLTGVPPDERR